MSILWCGGEDIDFPNGSALTVSNLTSYFRAGYGRCAVYMGSLGLAKSNPFPAGAITSCWLSVRVWPAYSSAGMQKQIGLGLSGTNKGLFVGISAANANKLALCKYDGTTTTELATETGTSIPVNVMGKLDVQLVNYGATATVNVYWNGAQVISYSGDVTVSGVSNLDSVYMHSINANLFWGVSEIVVADEDTRSLPGVVTLAPSAAGSTDQWTGTYSGINGTAISDTSPNYTNTATQDQQFNITDLPSGSFVIKAVKVSARMAKSADAAVGKVSLGYNNGGIVNFGTGAQKTLTTAYATYEQLDATDPTKSAAWAQLDMNALQLDVRSAT